MAVTYVGVDWLTMTTNDDKVGVGWYTIYVNYRKEMFEEANEEKPWNNGFYAGLQIAHMRWGYSENIGYILIVSGADAERMWQRLQPIEWRVTRLDLCVDYVMKQPSREASIAYHKLTRKDENIIQRYSLFVNNAGGETCYLGSRHSQQFGRLYDKGIEAGTHEQGLKWRAEVEYKKPLSGYIAKLLAEQKPEKRGAAMMNTVTAWFDERGAPLANLIAGGKPLIAGVEQRITTADRKLAWLRTQVAPTVVQLVEAGYGRKVLKCLLLDIERLKNIESSDI